MFLLCFAEHYLLTRNAGSICLYSVYISLLLAINSYFLPSLKLCDLVVVCQWRTVKARSSEYPVSSNRILNR